jgi:FkbH-like protein
MDKLFQKGLLLADFNISNLAGYLRNEPRLESLDLQVAPYGQVLQSLMQREALISESRLDLVVVWTRPESVIPSFAEVLNCPTLSRDSSLFAQLLAEIDQYAAYILALQEDIRLVLVPSWVSSAGSSHSPLPFMLELKKETGVARLLMQMNVRLAEKLESARNIFLLDAQRWIARQNGFSPKLWYMAKIPFSNDLFKEAAKDIAACVQGLEGKAKKLLVLDLDDTLWGGVVGDVGWQNLRLGGHDYMGEAYADFQKALKALTRRGVLLGLVSKNEESVALDAIRNHPEMVLKLDDFAGWKINWRDKAQNIADLAAELNLGLQSVVFIDDHPAERARVHEALPEVLVPEWPEDCMLYTSTLMSLRCFDTPSISQEDLQRTKLYASERERTALRAQVSDFNEWLISLELTIKVEKLNPANLQRAVQLLNKTNQMNLATRRMTESEMMAWAAQPGCKVWTFRVSDRLGDSGLTGLASVEVLGTQACIADFLLSCRVMGRKVEETMLHVAVKHAHAAGATEILAEYIPTAKNQPCLEFWSRSGFNPLSAQEPQSSTLFRWNSAQEYPLPDCVRLEEKH